MLTETATWLPVFPGFYGTYYENYDADVQAIDDKIDELAEDYKIHPRVIDALRNHGGNWDLLDVDYPEFDEECARRCCDWVEDQLKYLFGDGSKVVYEEIKSPREYNFANDSINATITVDMAKVVDYLHAHRKEFAKYLADNYTSYDGFWSYYSPEIKGWLPENATEDTVEWNDHQTGAVLDFILRNEFGNSDECEFDAVYQQYAYVEENVFRGAYVYVEDKFIEWLKDPRLKELSKRFEVELAKAQKVLEDKYLGKSGMNYGGYNNALDKVSGEWLKKELDELNIEQEDYCGETVNC